MKKMLGSFLYSTFSGKNLKALPENIQDEMQEANISSLNVDIDQQESEAIGVQSLSDADISEEEETEAEVITEFEKFFNGDSIPSIEKTEQFLIQQALKKFDGNRRKASEALGISERTLYRKLDQYEI
jgi:DNA-binding NtrC family response regulator